MESSETKSQNHLKCDIDIVIDVTEGGAVEGSATIVQMKMIRTMT